jgi:hypothetical protein
VNSPTQDISAEEIKAKFRFGLDILLKSRELLFGVRIPFRFMDSSRKPIESTRIGIRN